MVDLADFTAYWNGEWVSYPQIKIEPNDRGFFVGDAIYDAERTFNGKSFRLKDHIDRLYRSLNYIRLDPGLSPQEMLDISEEAIRRNEHMLAELGDLTIHQYVTRGPGKWTRDAGPPTVIVDILPIDFARFGPLYKPGIHAVIARTRSYSPEQLDPKIKHISRMNFSLADLEAAAVDPEAWAVLTDLDGNITEGVSNNVFLVTDGVLRTSGDRSNLQGVSRRIVFELARQLDIPVVEEDLQPYDFYTADEAFFSQTSFCILPVVKVDTRPLGDGKPGPITQQLLAAWSEKVGVDIADQAEHFGGVK